METTLATTLERQKWITNYFSEYVRTSKFKPYMGKSNNSIIIVKHELQTEAGKTINIPLITRLTGSGVTGSQILDGQEEELGNFNCALSVDWRRHGVRVPKSTQYKTEIDLLNAAREMLRVWEGEQLRDDIIEAGLSVIPATSTTTPVRYGAITALSTGGYEILAANYIASEANKDAWLVLNADRVQFGALVANGVSADHSTSLATLDTTADKLTPEIAELAKRRAKAASPHIRPFMTKDGKEYFVLFTHPRCFRDVKASTSMQAANRDARPRNVEANPIFQDGDLIKDGIIYREVEELPVLTDVGDSATTEVAANYLCGAQAFGVAWGQEPTPQTDRDKDYKFRPGVAIEELLVVEKLHFNGVQQGMVTLYCAAGADA